jgi:hypothetical protein
VVTSVTLADLAGRGICSVESVPQPDYAERGGASYMGANRIAPVGEQYDSRFRSFLRKICSIAEVCSPRQCRDFAA